MSLIQAALNKTREAQGAVLPPKTVPPPTRTTPVFTLPGVMDERLERELRDVQRFYNHRRSFRLKAVIVAVVTFAIAAILLFFHFISSPRVDKAPHAGVLPSQALPVVKVESAARTTAAAGLFRLSGILDLGEGLRAVINDEVVGVGDQVAKQAIVRHIASDSVILEVRGREVLLRL